MGSYGRRGGGLHLQGHERSDEQERPGGHVGDEREWHLQAGPEQGLPSGHPNQQSCASVGEGRDRSLAGAG